MPVTLFEIQLNAPNVTIDLPLGSDAADDIQLEAGETQRFQLTYAPGVSDVADVSLSASAADQVLLQECADSEMDSSRASLDALGWLYEFN